MNQIILSYYYAELMFYEIDHVYETVFSSYFSDLLCPSKTVIVKTVHDTWVVGMLYSLKHCNYIGAIQSSLEKLREDLN